jgi:cytochrome c
MRRTAILGCLAAVLGALALPSAAAAQRPKFDVLVFSKTAGFRHDSIPTGVDRIRQLGAANRFRVEATEDATAFRANNLRQYEAVVFLSTTGDVLNAAQQRAFENYIQDGGGFVGIHAAADTEYDWPFYGRLVGAYFKSHPAIQQATIKVADRDHPSTSHLPERWVRTDEWYDYQTNPRGDVHVLATLDETTYQGANFGPDHPIAWCHPFEGGRSWYTGGGHTRESFGEPAFQQHILGGIRWAAGDVSGDCDATRNASFQKVPLTFKVGEPMALEVLPDGRVLHSDRKGRVYLYDDETGINKLINTIPVYRHDEEGLQALAVDPNFQQNRWVYLYYSPPSNSPVDDPSTPDVNEGDAPLEGTPADWARFRGIARLSRVKLAGGRLDMDTEQRILDVPMDQGICCHVGGQIQFDGQGNLYLSTGDDTNPFQSQGYSPIDERPTRNPAFDAQRTSANTNDLRGKVLRVRPKAGGGYEIPAGNLFPAGAPKTRPEIYLMGLRNPFRIAVNPENGDLYVGDYSPDAGEADPERGPAGQGKWFVARGPGNYGWPYCATDEMPYIDGQFVPGDAPDNPGFESSGVPFDCDSPVNESPNNTGLRELPTVKHPDVWYGYAPSAQFPELGTGGVGPMGGPAYQFRRNLNSRIKWPQYYDGVPLFYEWTRDYIKEMRLDGAGSLFKINPVAPLVRENNPMDIEFGPDGALYTLEYGDGFFVENEDAQVARIDFVRGNRTPTVTIAANETNSVEAPLEVEFTSTASDPDGDRLTYEWDFDADGEVDSTEPNPTFTYTETGVFDATLRVTDSTGRMAPASIEIVVGNQIPVVTFVTPTPETPFQFGDTVEYEVEIQDDQPVDCSEVRVFYLLGHNEHSHQISDTTGCSGQITASVGDHGGQTNLFAVFGAEYRDPGVNGEGRLTGTTEVVLRPTSP